MKKFIIAATLVITTGVLAFHTKVNNTTKTVQSLISKSILLNDSKELASGD